MTLPFDPVDETQLEACLASLYAQALLAAPPVRVLDAQNPGRERIAAALALKDIRRLLRAVAQAGFALRLERKEGKDGLHADHD
jgi:hypothetical protein